MIYKAKSPASFAEEYIVESIWSGRFSPGSMLPAERELSESIGVTRTTLREVLQRLARDGWITIQHGKPTLVNDYWETCGLNILENVAKLDQDDMPKLVGNLLSVRTNVSVFFIRSAIKQDPERCVHILGTSNQVEDTAGAYALYDYKVHHDLAMASGNMVYVLMMNGFKQFHARIGGFYFGHEHARTLNQQYFRQLLNIAERGDADAVNETVRRYAEQSREIWTNLLDQLPADLMDN